ncbi:VaFE repeat-containing surface-anchored protein [Georgenia sunbinii]|uniref:VaFE repeat-containing surface-anchored protein n=1 Tax=Georgenia sunbinii TaxID=3117728 RepID=UPI003D9C2925
MTVGGWDDFPGTNNFATDARVREHVGWIVMQSYPQVTVAELAARSGIAGLTAQEAIAGTQAAIWSFTDSAPAAAGYTYRGIVTDWETDTTSAPAQRVGALVDYLTGAANVGLSEVEGPAISAEPAQHNGVAGTRVGPIRFVATEPTVVVDASTTYPLVDADGVPVDVDRVPTGTDLFLDVPAGAPAGAATLTASIVGPQRTGMLVTNTDPRSQTLMIARSDQARVSTTAAVDWAAVPTLATTARDGHDGDSFLPEDGPAVVVDTVRYEGLLPGTEYQLDGELMLRDGSEGRPTGITATTRFTPAEPAGSVELTFEVPAGLLHGEVIVVFEHLSTDGRPVASHADIDDEGQTVYRPAIETDAYDLLDLDQILAPGGATLRDDVAYSGLRVGDRYTLRGDVMDHATGEPTGITGETEFVAQTSSGVVSVDFKVPAGYAGTTLVVFERLYLQGADRPAARSVQPGEVLLATHTDLDEVRQTVVVDEEPPPPPPGDTPDEEEPAPPPADDETPRDQTPPPAADEEPVQHEVSSTEQLPATGASVAGGWVALLLAVVGTALVAAARLRRTQLS